MTSARRILLAVLASCAATAALQAQVPVRGGYAPAAPTADPIPELEGVDIVDRLDSQVPLDAAFRDEKGNMGADLQSLNQWAGVSCLQMNNAEHIDFIFQELALAHSARDAIEHQHIALWVVVSRLLLLIEPAPPNAQDEFVGHELAAINLSVHRATVC